MPPAPPVYTGRLALEGPVVSPRYRPVTRVQFNAPLLWQ